MNTTQERTPIPPVMNVMVEDSMDIMIARNTARRAGGLLGFSPAGRAQLASAVAELAKLILRADSRQFMHLNGVSSGSNRGIQVTCDAPWLADYTGDENFSILQERLRRAFAMMDDVTIEDPENPSVVMILWRPTVTDE
jgi:hypothetical protein